MLIILFLFNQIFQKHDIFVLFLNAFIFLFVNLLTFLFLSLLLLEIETYIEVE